MLSMACRSAAILSLLAVAGAVGGRPTISRGQETRTYATFRVTHFMPQIPNSGPISSAAVDPDDERYILVASESGGVFSSTDGGANWTHQDGLDTSLPQDVAFLHHGPLEGATAIVTATENYDTSNAGGAYTGPFGPTSAWNTVSGVVPASCGSDQYPGGHGVSIAPDTYKVYIATDCGLAAGNARATSFTQLDNITGDPNQPFESVVALHAGTGGQHLIVGGPSGVWYSQNGGTSWAQSTGITGTADLHGLGSDPRGGDNAFLVTTTQTGDRTRQAYLYHTSDGGQDWTSLSLWTENSIGCGGIAGPFATMRNGSLTLYVSDRCTTRFSSFRRNRWSAWTALTSQHGNVPDSRELVFHPAESAQAGEPFLLTSDGGIETTTNHIDFHFIGGPAHGLDADQVTEVAPQYVGTSGVPDVYFATQHNWIWSANGSTGAVQGSFCCEGFSLGVPSHIATLSAHDPIVFASCAFLDGGPVCPNFIASARLNTVNRWSNAELIPPDGEVGGPTPIGPGTWVQQVDDRNTLTGSTGIQLTTDEGSSWRQIANLPIGQQYGSPKSSMAGGDTVLTQVMDFGPSDGSGVTPPASYGAQDVIQPLQISGFSSGGTGSVRYLLMQNFGSVGVVKTSWASYEVLAVDPDNPSHIIAPDVFTDTMKSSSRIAHGLLRGDDNWTEIPNLTALVTHHNRYRFSVPDSAQPRRDPLVSTISFCPDNSSRVLIGTHEGGAYFSLDGGSTWSAVTGSDPITWATSISWNPGCGSAYMSSYGRGIWNIAMDLHTELIQSNEPCDPRVCRLEQIVGKYLRQPHPWPSPIAGLVVSDGFILRTNHTQGKTVVKVSDGSVVTGYKSMPKNVKVVRVSGFHGERKSYTQAVFFSGKGKLLGHMRGAEPLVFNPLPKPSRFKGQSRPNIQPRERVRLEGGTFINGTSTMVLSGGPLVIDGELAKPMNATLLLTVDGKNVAKFPPGVKGVSYVDKSPAFAQGYHDVQLLAEGAKGNRYLASAPFLVPHLDDDSD